MIQKLEELKSLLSDIETQRLVIIAAEDDNVLEAAISAMNEGLITPILVGESSIVKGNLEKLGSPDVEVIHSDSLEESVSIGFSLIRDKKADYVMKGLIDTSVLLKGLLDKQYDLRTGKLLSHVMIYETPQYHKLLCVSDGGMNIAPTLEQKEDILMNAYEVYKALGYEKVKACGLGAKEKVNPKMPATVDANDLEERLEAEDLIYEGPLALDLALSKEAAETKGFKSEVAGDVDIILVPTIEVGNALGKAMTYVGQAESAGIIMGAKIPVVLTSRADDAKTKLYSIALGAIIAKYMKGE